MSERITSWTELSRRVGFEARVVEWPSGKTVEGAIAAEDVFSLLEWSRFLTPRDPEELALMSLIDAAIGRWKGALR